MSGQCNLEELAKKVKDVGPRAINTISQSKELEQLLEEFRRCFVLSLFSDQLLEVHKWIEVFRKTLEESSNSIGAKGVLLPRELRSFVNDPLHHLMKKLFNYAYEYARGRINYEEFKRTGEAAIRTSIRSNMRSLYEGWVFLSIVKILGQHYGARIVFPEHMHILLERSGRQRGGGIPPNLVLQLEGKGYLSLYLEAPRPIGWGDTRDLTKSWKLYVALRPDMMVYGGRILDIVKPSGDPPVEQPDALIECKELEDWFLRSREVRGPLAEPMTAEEWRSRWIKGLWAGLADILGIESVEKAYEEIRRRKGIRLTEPQIIKLYVRLYRPKKAFLVSRKRIPSHVKKDLESTNILVFDDVGFNESKLRDLAFEIEKLAGYRGVEKDTIIVNLEVVKKIDLLMQRLGAKSREEVLKILIDYAFNTMEDIKRFATQRPR